MSFMLDWCSQNPKKAALLSTIGLITAYNKTKAWLKKPKSLKGKIIVITGGACGLGKLLSFKCYDEGSIVIIWDVNRNAIKEFDTIKPNENGGAIYASYVDVTKKSMVNEATNLVLTKYGKIDILIQNAGVVAGRPLLELSESDIRRTYDVNVISQYFTLQAVLPSMIANKNGHIVSIVSITAFVGFSHLTDYCASKAAARSLDQSIKRELIDLGLDEGIVFTGIFPGVMNTGMFEGVEIKDYMGSTLLSGKEMLKPEDVAHETMEAIRYEKREVIVPQITGPVFYWSQALLPHKWLDNLAINSGNMKGFVGGQNRLSKL
eukprot:159138_1